MGWTGLYRYDLPRDNKGNPSPKMYLDKEFGNCENEKYKWELLKSAMVGSTYYSANKRINKETGEAIVYGLVILTSFSGHDFYYKEISEDMGPCQYDCPQSILKLLTPTDEKWALEWRRKCEERNIEKLNRKQFFKLAKDKTKIKCIKCVLDRTLNDEYKEGDINYLYYGSYFHHGKLKNVWRDECFVHWPSHYIKPECCTLIGLNGEEYTFSLKGGLEPMTTF